MASSEDFIPSNDAKFDAFYKNYCQIVTQRTSGQDPEWTHIPAARVTELNAGYAAWYTAWSKLRQPHMDADVAAKNDAKAAGTKIIRAFTNEFIRYSTAVSVEDKRSLGVHIPDPTPTPIPDPKTRPEFGLRVADIRKIRGDFRDQGSESKARPYGMDGAVVSFAVADAAVTSTGGLTRSFLATRTPFTLEFTDEERGKIVSVALQWQNEKGRKGGFSEIQSTIIP